MLKVCRAIATLVAPMVSKINFGSKNFLACIIYNPPGLSFWQLLANFPDAIHGMKSVLPLWQYAPQPDVTLQLIYVKNCEEPSGFAATFAAQWGVVQRRYNSILC
jgi:hypothetical protein